MSALGRNFDVVASVRLCGRRALSLTSASHPLRPLARVAQATATIGVQAPAGSFYVNEHSGQPTRYGGAMYTAKWLRHGKVLGTERYDDRERAIHQAVARFPAFEYKFGATAAEVWDDDGARHLRHVGDR